jgi:ubiquinol-cytochrome c reductase cytochrome c1 subunit
MKKILASLLVAIAPAVSWASEGGVVLDRAPINLADKISLQRGAAAFVNHCLNCHSAGVMRYARLEDLGLSEAQIRDFLIFTEAKVGDTMATAMDPKVAKAAFGVVPPDLSLAARSRSPDWLYTYLRGFYRDPEAKSGWNNTAFPNVAMPHVLWEYQGNQIMQVDEKMDSRTGDKKVSTKLVLDRPGTMTRLEYDKYTADLVNYLAYMAEPGQTSRRHWGILVLFFLAGFFVLALLLKQEYWNDVR